MKTLNEFAAEKKEPTYKRLLSGKAGHIEKQIQRLQHIRDDLKDHDSPAIHAAIDNLDKQLRLHQK